MLPRTRPGPTLGGPPGDYTTGDRELDLREPDWEFHSIMTAPPVILGEVRIRFEWWRGDDGSLWVCFDEQDRVVAKKLTPGRCTPNLLARLRRWLGL